jgi:hypothetical protein
VEQERGERQAEELQMRWQVPKKLKLVLVRRGVAGVSSEYCWLVKKRERVVGSLVARVELRLTWKA